MLEMLGIAIASGTVKALVTKLLENLQEKATDKLIDTVSETLINTVDSKINNPDDVVTELKKIPELQHITTTQITKCFENIHNSIIIAESPGATIYKDCKIQLQADKNEIMAVIIEILETLPVDNPQIIRSLQPFFKKVENAIEECYNFEDKKELIKSVIKEKFNIPQQTDLRESRLYDHVLEIIPILTKQELNLLAILFMAYRTEGSVEIEENADIKNIPKSEILDLVYKGFKPLISLFNDIGEISELYYNTTFARYGLVRIPIMGISKKPFSSLVPEKFNLGDKVFDFLLTKPEFKNIKRHKKVFIEFYTVLTDNIIFNTIGWLHYCTITNTSMK